MTAPQSLPLDASASPMESNSVPPPEQPTPGPTRSLRLAMAARALLNAAGPVVVRKVASPVLAPSSPMPLTDDASRLAFLKAVASQNLGEVKRVVALGADVNFYAQRNGRTTSPLGLACASNWETGALLLIEGGALDSLAEAQWMRVQHEKTGVWPQSAPTTLQTGSARVSFPSVFEALIAREPAHAVHHRQTLVRNALNAPWGLESIVRSRAVGDLDAQGRASFEALLFVRPVTQAQRATFLQTLWTQAPELLQMNQRLRLREILRLDALESLEVLAQTGYVETPSTLYAGVRGYDFAKTTPRYSTSASHFEGFRSEAHEHPAFGVFVDPRTQSTNRISEEPIPLWAAAVALEAPRCLKALASVPEMAQYVLDDPTRRGWLALSVSAPILREAQRQGLDLLQCVNHGGETPLHLACHSATSKTRIQELAKLCPAWMDMRDAQGRTPAQCIPTAAADLGSSLAGLERLSLSIGIGALDANGKKIRKAKASKLTAIEAGEGSPSALPSKPRTRRL